MKLYHFTSSHHLYGISRHGLTVGDVPTDISKAKGRCGVWLTLDPSSAGHGLEGSSVDKTRFRMTVQAPDNANLVKWKDWAAVNVTTDTRRVLHSVGVGFDTWFVYFGVIARSAIAECVDMVSGASFLRIGLTAILYPQMLSLSRRGDAKLGSTKTIKQANREA